MKLKKYFELFSKINEDDHIIKDENVPFKKLNSVDKVREENARKNTGLTSEKEKELEKLRDSIKRDREYYARKHDGILDDDVDGSEDYEPTDDEISLAGKTLDDLVDGEEDIKPPVVGKTNNTKVKESGEAYTEDDLKADMENLVSLITDLFKNSDIQAEVVYDGLDIDIYVFLHKREKMKDILKIFSSVLKLKTDILPQYKSEVDLYESNEKWPIIQFRFEYDTGVTTVTSKKEEIKALPPSRQEQQGNLFVDDPIDLSTRTDSDSQLPF